MAEAVHPAGAYEHEHEHEHEHEKTPRIVRIRTWAAGHRRTVGLLLAGLVVLAVAAVFFVRHLRSYESTDDAQVDGDISAIGARVSGTVIAVMVQDNQHVSAGDVLAELDPADYLVALRLAEANLAQVDAQAEAQAPTVPITQTSNETNVATSGEDVATATAQLAAAGRDEESARARLSEAEAKDRLARIDLARSQQLVDRGSVSVADLDQHRTAADAASAELAAARAAAVAAGKQVEQQRQHLAQTQSRLREVQTNGPKQLDIQRANVASRDAAVAAARAAMEKARLDLGYTKIIAPVSGIVGKKAVNVGDHVDPGQQLLALVQNERMWVIANFKETQLERMHPGQRVRVSVDAFGKRFSGAVESMPGASGARYSLFPPENATGNYVKVVQRLPVRIALDPGQTGAERLRPGMSVEPHVYVR